MAHHKSSHHKQAAHHMEKAAHHHEKAKMHMEKVNMHKGEPKETHIGKLKRRAGAK